MEHEDLVKTIADTTTKLNKAQRQVAALRAKSKALEDQYVDSRTREANANTIMVELIERQRELNVMLNRANIMLHRTHEAMALSSVELNEMAKALPEPKKAEWSDRVAKINELFQKTGIQDAEISAPETPTSTPSDSLSTDELKKESEKAFGSSHSVWKRPEKPEAPKVESEIVEDEPDASTQRSETVVQSVIVSDGEAEIADAESTERFDSEEDRLGSAPDLKKTWWQRIAG